MIEVMRTVSYLFDYHTDGYINCKATDNSVIRYIAHGLTLVLPLVETISMI